jgi:hypothetical protein
MSHRAWLAVVGLCSTSSACGAQTPSEVPPVDLTHHAVVEGVVVTSKGQPLAGISVGTRFAASSPSIRQVSVAGGAVTDETGRYQFEIQASKPKTLDDAADLYVVALRYGKPGEEVGSDSVLVTVSLVPVDEVARPPVRVNVLRIPGS